MKYLTGCQRAFFVPFVGGLFGGVLVLGLASVQVQALTLQQAVQLAVDTHPTVQGAEAARRARNQQIKQARAPFYPTVDVRAATGYERSNTPGTRGRAGRGIGPSTVVGVGPFGGPGSGSNQTDNEAHVDMLHTDSQILVRQMLFDGFETWNRTAAAEIRVKAAGFQVRDAEEIIALRAVEAYLSVQRNREIVTLAEENVEAHVDVLGDVRIRAREGGGSIADVRQAEARLALARTRLTNQRGELRDAETDFIEAIGTAPDNLELADVPEDLVPETMEASVEEALSRSPVIRAAATTVDARRTDVEASKGVMWPRLDIELTAQRNQNISGSRGMELFYRAFGVVRWNLFQGGANLANTRRLNEVASQAVQSEAEQRRLVVEQMRIDFNARQVASDRIPTLEDRVLAADQVVAAYRQQFQLGQRTLLDVLDVENELFQARVALVAGEFAYRVANYQMLSTIGTLGPALGVVEPEETMAANTAE
ncbi:MAG: TolC family outer membrane protein [Alphaproteobacteria bacterium]|nr:TolC family outer membrane protein [Alphaproteobacteria bacterium]